MSSSEQKQNTASSCAAGPCACCMALAQVRMPQQFYATRTFGETEDGEVAGNGHERPAAIARTSPNRATNDGSDHTTSSAGVSPLAAEGIHEGEGQTIGGGAEDEIAVKTKSNGSKSPASFLGKIISSNGKSQKNSKKGRTESDASTDDWHDEIALPKVRKIWHGLDGAAVTLFGVIIPSLMVFLTCCSMPKRVTLVLLNHPIETIVEMLLVLAVPALIGTVWASLCGNKIKFTRLSSVGVGIAAGSSFLIAGLCIAAMFISSRQMELDSGTDFSTGFSWIAILSLLAAASAIFVIGRLRATRDFARTKRQVAVCSAIGALVPLVAFAACETRPWAIRFAEHMAVAASKTDQKNGLSWLRNLNPERELRMECSDPRASGFSGLFIPLKPSSQHQLYFALTGKPYSFREFNNTDLSSMPDDYLTQNVVGDVVNGLSLTRSTMTGSVHPRTMSSSLSWTFVFKNDTAQPQEARAEIGLPPGAVVNGLTLWKSGEPLDADFVASGKADGVATWTQIGHDSPAIVTDLGHGRVLMHCYPVPQDEECKVRISLIVPLNPDRAKAASLTLPKFIAANFGLSGEHSVRIRDAEKPMTGVKNLHVDRAPAGNYVLSGNLSADDLKSSKLIVDTARPADGDQIAVLDAMAVHMAHEEQRRLAAIENRKNKENEQPREQVLVMVDGSKGLDNQIDVVRSALARKDAGKRRAAKTVIKAIPARFVTESVERIATAAPKHLVVVIDGSATTKDYVDQVRTALDKLPAGIPSTLIFASQEQEDLSKPMPLAQGVALLKNAKFIGGQDNLKAVVQAAELAGDTRDSAVLWLHGPQPSLNQEIYIMSPYVSAPAFYEMTLGTGETDTFDFFKNHPEIGPFHAIPRHTNSAGDDLASFFGRWTPDSSSYAVKLSMTTKKPENSVSLSREEENEVLTLHASKRCTELLADKRSRMAALVAVRYGFVSPVSSALVSMTERSVNEGGEMDAFASKDAPDSFDLPDKDADGTIQGGSENPPAQNDQAAANDYNKGAPVLQGATNGTISGINTAGTVRVNNLANLEALLNIIANLAEVGLGLAGLVILVHGFARGNYVTEFMGQEIEVSPGKRIAIGVLMIMFGLSVPGMINWFVASARDANLFS